MMSSGQGGAVIINSRAVASLFITIARDPPRVQVGTGKWICGYAYGTRNPGDAGLGSGSREGEGYFGGSHAGVTVLR